MITQTTSHLRKIWISCCFVLLSVMAGFSQSHATFTVDGFSSTSNTMSFDVYITNDGTTQLQLAAYNLGINHSSAILNGSTLFTTTSTNNAVPFTYNAGSRDSRLGTLNALSQITYQHTANGVKNHMRFGNTPVTLASGNTVALETNSRYKLGRFTFANSGGVNWSGNSNASLAFQLAILSGYSNCVATCYVDGAGSSTAIQTSLVSGAYVNSPYMLNTCTNTSSTETVAACDTYTWSVNDQTYTASGTYTSTTPISGGCTDTKTLNLTINNSTSSTESQTACGSYTWSVNGQAYTESGTYTSTGTNAAGCPDTKTLVLTIINASQVYFADTDADGYGDASASTVSCEQPSGYVTDNTDCDDTNAAVNPGASEVSNGIDDDCDGTIDEGFTPAAPGVTNLSLCKGTPSVTLTATAFAGYTLKWYATATIATALASAPVATTSTVGSKSWWVTQRLGTGPESARAQITVTILALPTEVLGAITSNTESTTTPGTYLAATTAVGVYVGTTTPVTYRVPAFADNTLSYYWTVPTGVTVVSQTANTLTVNFLNVASGIGAVGSITVQAENANGCRTAAKSVALTKVLPAAPSTVKMTDALLPLPTNGIPTAVTSFAKYMGTDTVLTLTATASLTATSYVWELPTGVNVVSGDPLTDRIITVDFSGVTSSNTFSYYTTGTVPVLTHVLRIGVKSRNGVGVSTTSNAALTNPTTTSTAKLLTLKATLPAAPSAVKLTNDAISTTTAVTIISKYVGTNTPLTLTATASVLASSYEWELPAGVTVVSGNPLTDRVITVNFSGIPSGVTSYYLGVRAKNGIGYSVTNNAALTPATSSTAKLLKVTTTLPAAVSAVSGQLVALCGGSTYSYTMTASLLANSYVITAPTGSVVTSASNTGNTSNVLSTSDLTFSVTYPVGFAVATATPVAEKTIAITSVNGVGNSAANKVLTLATALKAIGVNTNSYVNPNTQVASATLFGKCATQTIAVPADPYATSYVWTLQNGATGTSTTNSIVIDFSAVSTPTATTKNIIKVKAYNGCTYSAEKSITLTWDGIMDCPGAKQAGPEVTTVLPTRAPFTVKAYPNPYSENFNLSLNTESEENVGIVVYDMTGRLIERREVRPGDMAEQKIGDRLPSGVSNVVVTQGNDVKTLRVIKR